MGGRAHTLDADTHPVVCLGSPHIAEPTPQDGLRGCAESLPPDSETIGQCPRGCWHKDPVIHLDPSCPSKRHIRGPLPSFTKERTKLIPGPP